MELFTSVDDLARVLGGHRKWKRTVEALRRAPEMSDGVASSIGDALTYWVERAAEQDVLVASRRYLTVLQPLDGDLVVEVGQVVDLDPVDDYSDLSDRQHLRGSGVPVTLHAGAIAVVGPDEAVRVADGTADRLVVVRVTVEGASFHNK